MQKGGKLLSIRNLWCTVPNVPHALCGNLQTLHNVLYTLKNSPTCHTSCGDEPLFSCVCLCVVLLRSPKYSLERRSRSSSRPRINSTTLERLCGLCLDLERKRCVHACTYVCTHVCALIYACGGGCVGVGVGVGVHASLAEIYCAMSECTY